MHAYGFKVKIRRPQNSQCKKNGVWGISLLSSIREEVYLVTCSRDHLDNVSYVWPEIARI